MENKVYDTGKIKIYNTARITVYITGRIKVYVTRRIKIYVTGRIKPYVGVRIKLGIDTDDIIEIKLCSDKWNNIILKKESLQNTHSTALGQSRPRKLSPCTISDARTS